MPLRYLLDTDICIYIRDNRPAKVRARFGAAAPGEVAMSGITYGELLYGAMNKRSGSDRAVSSLHRFQELIPALPLPTAAAEAYGEIRNALSRAGNLIGPDDLWIAAHALTLGVTLVTNNDHEFRRVKDLKIENWAK